MKVVDFLMTSEQEAEDLQEVIDPLWIGQQLYQEGIHYFSLWVYWLECHPEFKIKLNDAEYYWRKVFY